jgi:hypothetical protein
VIPPPATHSNTSETAVVEPLNVLTISRCRARDPAHVNGVSVAAFTRFQASEVTTVVEDGHVDRCVRGAEIERDLTDCAYACAAPFVIATCTLYTAGGTAASPVSAAQSKDDDRTGRIAGCVERPRGDLAVSKPADSRSRCWSRRRNQFAVRNARPRLPCSHSRTRRRRSCCRRRSLLTSIVAFPHCSWAQRCSQASRHDNHHRTPYCRTSHSRSRSRQRCMRTPAVSSWGTSATTVSPPSEFHRVAVAIQITPPTRGGLRP